MSDSLPMFQLILAIVAIALSAAQMLAGLNYTPAWVKTASDTDLVARTSMQTLEQAFDIATSANSGTPPTVTAAADGGLATNFLSIIKFTPAAPQGYQWIYGQHANDGSRYANMYYFCLSPTAGAQATQGIYRGIQRSMSIFPADEVYVNTGCGATVDYATPTSFPASMALTMYVSYVQPISP
jgi:hypothetical protein